MRTILIFFFITFFSALQLIAQRNCSTMSYQQQLLQAEPLLAAGFSQAAAFADQYILRQNTNQARTLQGSVIKIPVVVHILYHYPSENISDAVVHQQIDILNKAFRRQNADTINTPSRFAGLGADCEIEFQLASSDPKRKSTNGIIRKYTPIKEWNDNDKMKFAAEMGSDAWDSKSYLNIWVCNMRRVAGYASLPGGPAERDGVVLDFPVFGIGNSAGFDQGKTAVHEVGHWLGLRHLWGDEHCGDDGVHDTPKQAFYNTGCPSGVRITCGNGPDGDMYMNYMDFTNDACMNLFTRGQAQKMQALFVAGGARHSLLNSTGLNPPLIVEAPLPDEPPRWLHPQLYPNPTTGQLTLDLSYDERWMGKIVTILNLQGQVMMQVTITSKVQVVNVSNLGAGMYLLVGKKEDGETIKQKFIRL